MSEWKKVKLGEICERVTSGGTPKANVSSYYNPPTIPWLKTKEVNYCRITETENYISEEGLKNSSAKLISPNSVIIAMYGQGDTAGRVAINKIPLATNQACCNLTIDKNKADYEFIYYQLCTLYDKLVSLKAGAAQPNLNARIIKNLEIIMPSLPIQHRIATILSRYDSLIENYQKQIKLLEEAAQRLYKEWFIDLRFPGHENTNIIDGVPEGWEKKKLHEIAEVVMGSSPKSEFYNNDKQGLPFHQGVGSYGTRFVDDNVYSTSITRLAEPNSILFSVRAPVGRLNITKNKIIIGRGLAAMNHKDGFQSFLFYMLKERFFMDNIIGNGSIFASISKVELLDQEFIVPPMKTIKAFESLASKLDKKIQGVDTQLRLLTEARDRLLPKLMSGEITV